MNDVSAFNILESAASEDVEASRRDRPRVRAFIVARRP